MAAREQEILEEIQEINKVRPDIWTILNLIIGSGANLGTITTFVLTIVYIISDSYRTPDEPPEHEDERLALWQIILSACLALPMTIGTAFTDGIINMSGQSSENTSHPEPIAEESILLLDIETPPSPRQLTYLEQFLLGCSYAGETGNMAGDLLLTLYYVYGLIYSEEELSDTINILFFLLSVIPSSIATYALFRTALNNLYKNRQTGSAPSEEASTEDTPAEAETKGADWLTNFRAVMHFLSDFCPTSIFFSTLLKLLIQWLAQKNDANSIGKEDSGVFSPSTYLAVSVAFSLVGAHTAAEWFIMKLGQSETSATPLPTQHVQEEFPETVSVEQPSKLNAAYLALLGLFYVSEVTETAGIFWLIGHFLSKLIYPHWEMEGTANGILLAISTLLGVLKAVASTRTVESSIKKIAEHSYSSTSSITGWLLSWFPSGNTAASPSEVPAETPSNQQPAQTSYAASAASCAASCVSWIGSPITAAQRWYAGEENKGESRTLLVPQI